MRKIRLNLAGLGIPEKLAKARQNVTAPDGQPQRNNTIDTFGVWRLVAAIEGAARSAHSKEQSPHVFARKLLAVLSISRHPG